MAPDKSTLLAIGRVMLASLFVWAGVGKLSAPAATQAYIVSSGLPLPVLSYWCATAFEIGGGLLLVMGIATPAVAMAMAAFTVLTAAVFHASFADPAQATNFMKNVAIAGGFFALAANGAGAWTLASWRLRPPTSDTET